MNKAQLEKKADANINLRILIYAGIGIIVFGILYSIGVIDGLMLMTFKKACLQNEHQVGKWKVGNAIVIIASGIITAMIPFMGGIISSIKGKKG